MGPGPQEVGKCFFEHQKVGQLTGIRVVVQLQRVCILLKIRVLSHLTL